MLNMQEIRRMANHLTYQKGQRLYQDEYVRSLEVEPSDHELLNRIRILGIVRDTGGRVYEPELTVSGEETIIRYTCHCPDSENYLEMCPHCVALAMKLRDRQRQDAHISRTQLMQGITRGTNDALKQMMYQYTVRSRRDRMGDTEGEIELECSFLSDPAGLQLECRIGTRRMYVIKNLVKFVRDVQEMQTVRYGQNLEFLHDLSAFNFRSRERFRALEQAVMTQYPNYRDPFFAISGSYRQILLRPHMVELFLNAYCGESLRLDEQSYPILVEDPRPLLELREVLGGANLHMERLEMIAGQQYVYVKKDHRFYRCSEDFARDVIPLWQLLGSERGAGRKRSVFLCREDYGSFCGNVLPAVRPYLEIESGSLNLEDYEPEEPKFAIYLEMPVDQIVRASARVTYGEETFDLLIPALAGGPFRNWEREQDVRTILRRYFPEEEKTEAPSAWTTILAVGDDAIYTLADHGLQELQTAAELFVDESIRGLRVRRSPRVNMGIGYHGDLLDLQIRVEQMDPTEVQRILEAYRHRKKYYRLQDGDFLRLEDSGIGSVAELAEGLSLTEKEILSGKVELPAYRALYLESVLGKKEELKVKKEESYRQLIRRIREFSDGEYEVPGEIRAELRWYQKQGFQWLSTLCDTGLGGILADDMGLGKTLEMITLFTDRISRGETRPILVVTPASLLYNWENEVHRFAPGLTVQIIAGTAAERREKIEHLAGAQISITSYDMLRRDAELYEETELAICVLDEAQYIKNAGTQTARAVKALRASHRFAMTGTPVENRLSDLWSIFDFLMPGYLFDYRRFSREFEVPIVRDDDDVAMVRLQRMVTPFLLRRKKRDVLKDLPDKMEDHIIVRMTEEQRRIYDAALDNARKTIVAQMQEGPGMPESVLREITRICRLCDSPGLEYENYDGGSGKVDMCLELLATAVDEGHRVLVYSHYTGMLELLQKEWIKRIPLTKAEDSFLYFHGAVPPRRRQAMVDRFQRGEVPVFFISLKSGGTGLNLTAADMVIHCDPWWNEAAQDQATARAWRIGQTRDVTVFKLVCRNSIEEKILALQQKKAALSDRIMEGEGVQEFRLDREALLEIFS